MFTEVIRQIGDINAHVDLCVRDADDMREMIRLQQTIRGQVRDFNLVVPGRRLIKQGPLMKVCILVVLQVNNLPVLLVMQKQHETKNFEDGLAV
jgi:hypothetical protein